MKNREFNKFRHAGGGVGGYKCRCCGPMRKDRPAYNRRVRRKLNQQFIRGQGWRF